MAGATESNYEMFKKSYLLSQFTDFHKFEYNYFVANCSIHIHCSFEVKEDIKFCGRFPLMLIRGTCSRFRLVQFCRATTQHAAVNK